ncbi:MAG: class I SAM-dependent methyltransferase, partial [Clostridia bacterium]|nr:class I SAM-dependent methyltransferase [Clostridia bacterium]
KALAQWAIVDDYNTILDLHCQDTRLLRYFTHRFRLRACGIADDVNQARALRGEAPEAEIFCGRKEDIPWRSGSFDSVFYQVKKTDAGFDPAFLPEALRVLKAGGQLLIAIQGLPEIAGRAAHAVGLCSEAGTNTRGILAAMESAGFDDVSCHIATPTLGVAIGWKHS